MMTSGIERLPKPECPDLINCLLTSQ